MPQVVREPAPHHRLRNPANRHPAAARPTSRTCVLRTKTARQVDGQSIPAGKLRTDPSPTIVTNAMSWDCEPGGGEADDDDASTALATTHPTTRRTLGVTDAR